jgi:hypothetical protein
MKESKMVTTKLKLIGLDGNAFLILSRARTSAVRAGWTGEEIDRMMEEAKSGNYDHLLQTMMKYFDVC